jgi:hypothetical protein
MQHTARHPQHVNMKYVKNEESIQCVFITNYSVDGITNRYELDGTGIESRCGPGFPYPRDWPTTHPDSSTIGTGHLPGGGGKEAEAWP